jgi:hypothetical protein
VGRCLRSDLTGDDPQRCGLQALDNKALSWNIIWKRPEMLTEITYRKSQDFLGLFFFIYKYKDATISPHARQPVACACVSPVQDELLCTAAVSTRALEWCSDLLLSDLRRLEESPSEKSVVWRAKPARAQACWGNS